jgi:non-ribosomal peptide synthetase component F/acyl carrier protein
MVPQQLVRLERMPLNPSGKVDRRALPAPVRRERGGADYEPPRTPSETMLAALWEKALALPRVGRGDDFFALGGHSLLAAQVLSRLNREHGIVLPFRTIFEAPTIAQFAAAIDARAEAGPSASASPIARREQEPQQVSLMQERILLLEELDPERRHVHNVPSVFRLEGPLDADALEKAIAQVLRRQENLRSTFHKQDGVYCRRAQAEVRVPLERRDLRELAEDERERQVRAFVRQESTRPFDLEHGPLLRAFLFRLRDDLHYLFTLRHNTVWDGWSFDVFRRELAAFYGAELGLGAAALPELPVRYSDFAAWHREWLASPEADKQLAFWRERLAGHPGPVELPTDRPRRAEREYGGANEWIDIPRSEADAVAELGQKLGGTSFMVLLAAFNALLHRYTGQRDLLVACPVRNRPRPEVEDLAGLFTNTLMLRNRVDPDMSFAELVKAVRATTLDAFSHQELPFEKLASDAPPVRVVFSLQEGRHRETALGPVKLSLPHLVSPAIAVDMNFWFVEMAHGLAGAVNYSTQLFDQETIRGFIAHYRALLRSAVRDASQPVGRLALADSDERPDTPAAPAPVAGSASGSGLQGLLSHAPAHAGDVSPAAEAARGAAWLRSRGVKSLERVGVAARGAHRVAALLALHRIGAVPVPLDPAEPKARLVARLEAAAATWLLSDPDTLDELAWDDARSLSIEELASFEDGRFEEAVTSPSTAWVATAFKADGDRVAAEVSWHSLLARLEGASERLGWSPATRVALPDDAPTFACLLPLAAGARAVFVPEDDALDGDALRAFVEREAVNALVGPPALWRRLLGSGYAPAAGFVAVVSEPVRDELAARLLEAGCAVFAAWGLEEAGDWCGLAPVRTADGPKALPEPLPGVAPLVLEPTLLPAPAFVPGELHVDLGGARPIPTGERVRRRADGRLEPLGRTDARVRVNGTRVEPGEVRLRLLEHGAVRDAELVLREDAPGEPRLVAYVVPAAGAAFTDTELRRHLRRSLPSAAIPQHVVSVETLPRRADGSLELKRLPTPFLTSRRESRPPQTDEEKLLLELCGETLGVPQPTLSDNFFDLGGHSLLALQLVTRIETRTRRRLKPRLLLLSTLEQVAAELARSEAVAG